jgi:UDP-GlcNAc:undecaprenyl-phosphate GlcNAc-1-phosphate transferase
MSIFLPVFEVLPAVLVSFILTRLMILVSEKTGFVNNPNPIVESHKIPTAYGGGISIGITIVLFLAFQYGTNAVSVKFILIICALLFAGLLDDLFRFSPLKKILIQLIVSILFLIFFINSSYLIMFIFILPILLSQNAWNLIDIMDGLAAGVSFILFFAMGIILLPYEDLKLYSQLSFITSFGVLGFRFLNANKAKIFLGETGSLLLGSLFAFTVLNVLLLNKTIAVYLLLLGIVPFFELIFLILVRTKKGIPFWHGSPDHFALRMLNNGHSVNSINAKVILFSIFYSSLIVIASYYLNYEITVIICFLISVVILIAAYFYFISLPAREIINPHRIH